MKSKNLRGFTLIELMVVIAVLAIISSIAAPSFKSFIANTQIRTTAESIRNGLQLARIEAVKRNQKVSFTLNSDTSWLVGCVIATSSCPATIQAKTPKEGSASTVKLTVLDSNSLSFNGLGTVDPAGGKLNRVDVDNTSISASATADLRVTVGSGGNVRVCDPNVSSTTDSRHC